MDLTTSIGLRIQSLVHKKINEILGEEIDDESVAQYVVGLLPSSRKDFLNQLVEVGMEVGPDFCNWLDDLIETEYKLDHRKEEGKSGSDQRKEGDAVRDTSGGPSLAPTSSAGRSPGPAENKKMENSERKREPIKFTLPEDTSLPAAAAAAGDDKIHRRQEGASKPSSTSLAEHGRSKGSRRTDEGSRRGDRGERDERESSRGRERQGGRGPKYENGDRHTRHTSPVGRGRDPSSRGNERRDRQEEGAGRHRPKSVVAPPSPRASLRTASRSRSPAGRGASKGVRPPGNLFKAALKGVGEPATAWSKGLVPGSSLDGSHPDFPGANRYARIEFPLALPKMEMATGNGDTDRELRNGCTGDHEDDSPGPVAGAAAKAPVEGKRSVFDRLGAPVREEDREDRKRKAGSVFDRLERLDGPDDRTQRQRVASVEAPEAQRSRLEAGGGLQGVLPSGDGQLQSALAVHQAGEAPHAEQADGGRTGSVTNSRASSEELLALKAKMDAMRSEVHRLRAAAVRKSQEEADKRSVVVTNVHFQATPDILIAHFSTIGQIHRATIVKDPYGQPTGRAYVEFANVSLAERALALSGSLLLMRPIQVIEKSVFSPAAKGYPGALASRTAPGAASASGGPPSSQHRVWKRTTVPPASQQNPSTGNGAQAEAPLHVPTTGEKLMTSALVEEEVEDQNALHIDGLNSSDEDIDFSAEELMG